MHYFTVRVQLLKQFSQNMQKYGNCHQKSNIEGVTTETMGLPLLHTCGCGVQTVLIQKK